MRRDTAAGPVLRLPALRWRARWQMRASLARRILAFNLMGLGVLVMAMLMLDPFSNALAIQRAAGLRTEVQLLARLVAAGPGLVLPPDPGLAPGSTAALHRPTDPDLPPLVRAALTGEVVLGPAEAGRALTALAAAAPILREGQVIGAVLLHTGEAELGALALEERRRVLQLFVIAALVAGGLSLIFASGIATPLSDLADTAEAARDRTIRQNRPGALCIPDLSARGDEIGRLSVALRGLVSALEARFEANERFAADVSHEIRNPLASLRSAAETLSVVRSESQRERLSAVIAQDVARLDRLVCDISHDTRLARDLDGATAERLDLCALIAEVVPRHAAGAAARGVALRPDLPAEPLLVWGVAAPLEQVLDNLLGNAVSFCDAGGEVRLRLCRDGGQAQITVEDTGPGIPEHARARIFERFYSERPAPQFGQHSGLGLAIAARIVDAHGGTIEAGNVSPRGGARLVVRLPA